MKNLALELSASKHGPRAPSSTPEPTAWRRLAAGALVLVPLYFFPFALLVEDVVLMVLLAIKAAFNAGLTALARR